MKKQFLPLALLLSVIMFSACGSTKTTSTIEPATGDSMQLFNYRWNLVEINGKAIDVNKEAPAYLVFRSGNTSTVTGFTGCNRLSGTAQFQPDGSISLSRIAVTKMACIGNNSEQPFLDGLSKTIKYSIANNQLQLSDGNNVLARFDGVGAGNEKLNGNWELSYVSGTTTALETLYANKKPILIFNFPGIEVSGNTSCNGFGAKVTVSGDKMVFGDMLSTMMACPGDGEQVFVKAMKQVTRYKLTDDKTLSLLGNEQELLRFVKK